MLKESLHAFPKFDDASREGRNEIRNGCLRGQLAVYDEEGKWSGTLRYERVGFNQQRKIRRTCRAANKTTEIYTYLYREVNPPPMQHISGL